MCEECGNRPAVVHFEKVQNGRKVVMNLCKECAEKKGVLNFFFQPGFSINNLLAAILGSQVSSAPVLEPSGRERRCPVCGMSYKDFARAGRLGCSKCYETFEDRLDPLLRRIHGSEKHVGKAPARSGASAKVRRELEQLKSDLASAVAKEAYEEAALIRDKIRELEKASRGEKS